MSEDFNEDDDLLRLQEEFLRQRNSAAATIVRPVWGGTANPAASREQRMSTNPAAQQESSSSEEQEHPVEYNTAGVFSTRAEQGAAPRGPTTRLPSDASRREPSTSTEMASEMIRLKRDLSEIRPQPAERTPLSELQRPERRDHPRMVLEHGSVPAGGQRKVEKPAEVDFGALVKEHVVERMHPGGQAVALAPKFPGHAFPPVQKFGGASLFKLRAQHRVGGEPPLVEKKAQAPREELVSSQCRAAGPVGIGGSSSAPAPDAAPRQERNGEDVVNSSAQGGSSDGDIDFSEIQRQNDDALANMSHNDILAAQRDLTCWLPETQQIFLRDFRRGGATLAERAPKAAGAKKSLFAQQLCGRALQENPHQPTEAEGHSKIFEKPKEQTVLEEQDDDSDSELSMLGELSSDSEAEQGSRSDEVVDSNQIAERPEMKLHFTETEARKLEFWNPVEMDVADKVDHDEDVVQNAEEENAPSVAPTRSALAPPDSKTSTALRFDFHGCLVPESHYSCYPTLYHHGEDPTKAGYTLQELCRLAQSSHSAQAATALETLGAVSSQAYLTDGFGLGLKLWFDSLRELPALLCGVMTRARDRTVRSAALAALARFVEAPPAMALGAPDKNTTSEDRLLAEAAGVYAGELDAAVTEMLGVHTQIPSALPFVPQPGSWGEFARVLSRFVKKDTCGRDSAAAQQRAAAAKQDEEDSEPAAPLYYLDAVFVLQCLVDLSAIPDSNSTAEDRMMIAIATALVPFLAADAPLSQETAAKTGVPATPPLSTRVLTLLARLAQKRDWLSALLEKPQLLRPLLKLIRRCSEVAGVQASRLWLSGILASKSSNNLAAGEGVVLAAANQAIMTFILDSSKQSLNHEECALTCAEALRLWTLWALQDLGVVESLSQICMGALTRFVSPRLLDPGHMEAPNALVLALFLRLFSVLLELQPEEGAEDADWESDVEGLVPTAIGAGVFYASGLQLLSTIVQTACKVSCFQNFSPLIRIQLRFFVNLLIRQGILRKDAVEYFESQDFEPSANFDLACHWQPVALPAPSLSFTAARALVANALRASSDRTVVSDERNPDFADWTLRKGFHRPADLHVAGHMTRYARTPLTLPEDLLAEEPGLLAVFLGRCGDACSASGVLNREFCFDPAIDSEIQLNYVLMPWYVLARRCSPASKNSTASDLMMSEVLLSLLRSTILEETAELVPAWGRFACQAIALAQHHQHPEIAQLLNDRLVRPVDWCEIYSSGEGSTSGVAAGGREDVVALLAKICDRLVSVFEEESLGNEVVGNYLCALGVDCEEDKYDAPPVCRKRLDESQVLALVERRKRADGGA